MRNIQKGAEPNSLTEHRCKSNSEFTADYDNYSEKDDLRVALVTEQRGICCYCMQRIGPEEPKIKIEHWQCQSRYPERQLDFSNMLGACKGGHGKRVDFQHCDTSKGSQELTFNPADANSNVESMFKFPGSGKILSASDDESIQNQLDSVLNLNNSNLVKNRKSEIDALRLRLRKKNSSDADLRRDLAKWNGDDGGSLNPFCQVIVYYLRKKLKMT